jgi:hypothetical protein
LIKYSVTKGNNSIKNGLIKILIDFDFWCFNATFSNISAISWRPVLVVEEAGVPGENHLPWASNCYKLYHLQLLLKVALKHQKSINQDFI